MTGQLVVYSQKKESGGKGKTVVEKLPQLVALIPQLAKSAP